MNTPPKSIFYVLTLSCFIFCLSCKSKQVNPTNTKTASNNVKTEGTVSHQYKSAGCETIIICKSIDTSDTLFLIPMTSLEKFDVNNLKISFSYRILRVHNPKGCKQGIPAQIFDVKLVK